MKHEKIAALVVFAVLVAGRASAVDWHSFPSPIQKGSLLISPGVGIGHFDTGFSDLNALLGGEVAFDYALPLDLPFTVGGELGIYGAKVINPLYNNFTFGMVPVLGRFAWHPNWEVKGLDTYAMVKAGFALGFWSGNLPNEISKGMKMNKGVKNEEE